MPKFWLNDSSLQNVPGIINPGSGLNFIGSNLVPFIISLLLFIVLALSLLFLIIGGITWITSGGDKEGLAKAKGTITYAIVGLVLALGSFIILRILSNFFGFDLIPKVAYFTGK